MMLLGKEYKNEDYVFCMEDGRHIKHRRLAKHFSTIVKKAEIDKANPHAIRGIPMQQDY